MSVHRLTTYLLLVLAAVFWGGTFVAGRQLASLVDPHHAALLRFCLASIVLLVWLAWQQRCLPAVSPRQLVGLLLLGATGVVAYNLLFFSGLQTVEAGRASLIIAANPVVIALVSHWLFGERLGPLRVTGVILSVAGAMIVIGRGELGQVFGGAVGAGELMLLGCVASWVAYTLIGKRLLGGMSPLVAVTYSSLLGTLLLAVALVWHDPAIPLPATVEAWLNLAYLAVFGTVLAFVWFYRGVHEIGAARAGQFINLVPVSGVTLGAWLLAEALTWSLLAGGALVLFGLWLTSRPTGAGESPDVSGR